MNKQHQEIQKEISYLARKNWNRLTASASKLSLVDFSQERVLFDAFVEISNVKQLSVADVVEVMKVYLDRAPWEGILVRDSSPSNGNSSNGETWALVRPKGMLASFGGSPFQAIYEPTYDIHEDPTYGGVIVDEDDKHNTTSHMGDNKDESTIPSEEQRQRSDIASKNHRKKLFGVPVGELNYCFGEPGYARESIITVPKGFRNPLILGEFANGGDGQEVVAASSHIFQQNGVNHISDWLEKHKNNQGIASSFDILISAALDYHDNRRIVRQLRTWTEEQYRSLVVNVLMVASVWPSHLSGNLTFVSSSIDPWLVLEQNNQISLFERERHPVRIALSRILEATSEFRNFRGISMPFDLSEEGKVIPHEESERIIRPVVTNFSPSEGQTRSAIDYVIRQLAAKGHDPEKIRASIADPVRIGDMIDPEGRLLRDKKNYNRAHPEKLLFNPIGSVSNARQARTYSSALQSSTRRYSDNLYNALGGTGDSDMYLSDGLWLSSDGSVSDRGR